MITDERRHHMHGRNIVAIARNAAAATHQIGGAGLLERQDEPHEVMVGFARRWEMALLLPPQTRQHRAEPASNSGDCLVEIEAGCIERTHRVRRSQVGGPHIGGAGELLQQGAVGERGAVDQVPQAALLDLPPQDDVGVQGPHCPHQRVHQALLAGVALHLRAYVSGSAAACKCGEADGRVDGWKGGKEGKIGREDGIGGKDRNRIDAWMVGLMVGRIWRSCLVSEAVLRMYCYMNGMQGHSACRS